MDGQAGGQTSLQVDPGADPGGGGALGVEAPPPLELQVLRHSLRIRSFVR